MKILTRLLALFLILPAVELVLLLWVANNTSLLFTVGLILVTGLVGGYLAKREGLSAWRRFNDRVGAGGLPGRELLDGVIILCAGLLLITPGVLSDLVGFLGLLSPTRALIRKEAMRRINKGMKSGTIMTPFGGLGDVGYGMGGGYGEPFEADTFEPDAGWRGAPSTTPRHGGPPTGAELRPEDGPSRKEDGPAR